MQNCSDRLRCLTETELVREAQQGSTDAYAELVRRHWWRMIYVARSVLKNPEDAEDAAQSACWSAFHHLGDFQGDSTFKTWLTSITLNHARMRGRELARAARLFSDQPADDAGAWVADVTPNPEQGYAAAEMVDALRREIRLLPSPLRQIMLLHVECCSSAELPAGP